MNYIKYMIYQKRKTNYIKNGGGFMANEKNKIETLFGDIKEFLKSSEKNNEQKINPEENTSKETNDKTQKDDFDFEIAFLEKQLDEAFNNFDLKKIEELKKKIEETKQGEQKEEKDDFDIFEKIEEIDFETLKSLFKDMLTSNQIAKELFKKAVLDLKNDK